VVKKMKDVNAAPITEKSWSPVEPMRTGNRNGKLSLSYFVATQVCELRNVCGPVPTMAMGVNQEPCVRACVRTPYHHQNMPDWLSKSWNSAFHWGTSSSALKSQESIQDESVVEPSPFITGVSSSCK
jgi:hypothetical protein